MSKLPFRVLAYPTLTDAQINEAAEAATKSYFEAILEQGRVFDHNELSLSIDFAIINAETKLFVDANR